MKGYAYFLDLWSWITTAAESIVKRIPLLYIQIKNPILISLYLIKSGVLVPCRATSIIVELSDVLRVDFRLPETALDSHVCVTGSVCCLATLVITGFCVLFGQDRVAMRTTATSLSAAPTRCCSCHVQAVPRHFFLHLHHLLHR